MQVPFCSPPDCRWETWKECGKYEEESGFRYQRLMDCSILSGGENVITDSSCSTVPVRMVLAGVLAAKYVECLVCTSLSMTILTVVMTVFVATNIKKWNAEFQIIYAMARIRKRSRKKAYNFRIN